MSLGAWVLLVGLTVLQPDGGVPKARTEQLGAAYFRSILDKEGAGGIVNRLYVAPPDLMTPLFSGIASGTPEWLEVYDRLRRGVASADKSGATIGYLDDSLARALAKSPAGVLSFLHAHSEIPVKLICGRTAPWDGDAADVLDPPQMLDLIRRRRLLSEVKAPELHKESSACLAATEKVVRRQLRIYLVSYGASDSRANSSSLTGSDRRELESALAKARADISLHVRGDGAFPDGPFRLQMIPRGVIKHCLDDAGRIANPEGPWEGTDYIRDARLPRARLLNACRVDRDVWDLTCQLGGFRQHLQHVRMRLTGSTWSLEQTDQPRAGSFQVMTAADNLWPDCRALSAPSAKSSPARP